MLDPFGSQTNRTADGCFPFRVELLHLSNHRLFVERFKGNELFHIITVPLMPVAISYQAHMEVVRQVLDETYKNILGNGDFGLSFYLAPHRARGVKYKHHVPCRCTARNRSLRLLCRLRCSGSSGRCTWTTSRHLTVAGRYLEKGLIYRSFGDIFQFHYSVPVCCVMDLFYEVIELFRDPERCLCF